MGLEDEVNELRKQQRAKPKEPDYGTQPWPKAVPPDRVDPGLAALIRETIPLIPGKRWEAIWKVNGKYYELYPNTKKRRLRLNGQKLGLAKLGDIMVRSKGQPRYGDWNYGLERNRIFLEIYSDGGVKRCGRKGQPAPQMPDSDTEWNASSLEAGELDLLRQAVVETIHGWKHVK